MVLRLFLSLSVFLSVQELAAQDVRLRVVSANLTSGNQQSYDPGHGARILQGLRPDVVLIQEFRTGDNTPAAAASWVRAVFGAGMSFFREEGELPNGIISRFPILASGEWHDPTQTNRDFAWARLDIPGERDLWAVSVHLSAGNSKKRLEAAQALVLRLRENVPESDLLVVGGDLNTRVRSDPAVKALATILETRPPYPADAAGNPNTNARRVAPYDWVLANPSMHRLGAPVPLGGSAAGLVFDSRIFTPLQAVSPVLPEDSAAPQMQHMAVVRDFLLPAPPDTAAELP